MGTTLHSMTAANGMVERTHCSLKAALMARCTDENWKAQLPWVLLGLHTAPRANGKESPTEKVNSKVLAIPGEFFPTEPDDPDTPLPRLREIEFKPYRVFSRTSKAYLVNIHGWEDWISIDRLKPAFLMDRGTWEETSRCPRIPPQNKTSDEEIGISKRGRGRPKGRTKDVISPAKLPDDSAVETTPQPQISRTRGRLLLPRRYHD
ncbi:uncharacterized protein [Macrobrachium rosenbergii]|uniref:uncharacterized protein n=1 Tax=Macrobrachium rosenbergii TaxID=79674 RepID=UPI0034D79E37